MDVNILNYYSAIVEFLQIYASQEIGEIPEVDNEVICNFINSDRFITFRFRNDMSSKGTIFKFLEEQILDGFPIHHFFKLSEWKINILDREMIIDETKERNKFLCYSCSYFKEDETPYGRLLDCSYVKEVEGSRRFFKAVRRERFEVVKICDTYKNKFIK